MKVLVTRPAEQSMPLVRALEAEGFEVVNAPLIAVEPFSEEPIEVTGYDVVVVTSANGARELARRTSSRPSAIAAVGPGTAAALAEAGLSADVVADVHTQEGLVSALHGRFQRALFVAGDGARSLLAERLGADVVVAYRTVELDVTDLPPADLALLMSASAARAYARAGGRGPVISIGPQTTKAARGAGVEVVAEARSHDLRGLVDCAASWRASSRS